MQRGFKCPCGKYYKTIYGLKNHASVHHGNSVSETLKFLETEMEIDGINHHHHHNHYHQEIKLNDEIKNNSAIMEDHVYVKQNRSQERDSETLGIITPASTPPLSTATITQQNAGKIETILYDRQVRYFAEANSDHSYNN